MEAITESVGDDEGCCCYEPGHLPFMLSCNKNFGSRWLAWEVVSSCYTLHGYSISENQAHLVFNSYEYKRNYVTYYSKVRWEEEGGDGGGGEKEGEDGWLFYFTLILLWCSESCGCHGTQSHCLKHENVLVFT